jgi:hypothetical protein
VRQEDSNTHLTPRTRGKTIALCMDKVTPLAFKRQFLMINIVLRVLVSCTKCTYKMNKCSSMCIEFVLNLMTEM